MALGWATRNGADRRTSQYRDLFKEISETDPRKDRKRPADDDIEVEAMRTLRRVGIIAGGVVGAIILLGIILWWLWGGSPPPPENPL